MNVPSRLALCFLSLLSLSATAEAQILSGVPIDKPTADSSADASGGADAAAAADRLSRTLEAIRTGKAEAAFSELRKVVKPQPSDHYLMGWILRYGEGADPDLDAAKRAFHAAGAGRVPQAYLHLAELARAAGEWNELASVLNEAAMMGEAGAMWQLACVLREGRGGVRKQPGRAWQWVTLAMENGHAEAKLRLRHFAREADQAGGKADAEQELKALRDAVSARRNQGVVSLQLGLRSIVDKRVDGAVNDYQKDNHKRAIWFLEPIAAGAHPIALFYVARMYETGRGVKQDKARAIGLYLQSARLGISTAADNVGLMFLRGEGTTKDPVAAAKLFHIAATAGDTDGMLNHGYCLGTGTGRERDLVAGAAWYQLAAARGNEIAAKNLEAVRKEMSEEQRDAAQRMNEALEKLVESRGFDPAQLPTVPSLPVGGGR